MTVCVFVCVCQCVRDSESVCVYAYVYINNWNPHVCLYLTLFIFSSVVTGFSHSPLSCCPGTLFPTSCCSQIDDGVQKRKLDISLLLSKPLQGKIYHSGRYRFERLYKSQRTSFQIPQGAAAKHFHGAYIYPYWPPVNSFFCHFHITSSSHSREFCILETLFVSAMIVLKPKGYFFFTAATMLSPENPCMAKRRGRAWLVSWGRVKRGRS